MNKFPLILISLTIILLVGNLGLLYFFDENTTRWIRFLSIFLFFLYFIWQPNKSRKMLLFFISYLAGDFFLIFFEDPNFKSVAFGLRTISFFLLSALVLKRLKNLKSNLIEIIVFVIAVIINIYLLINLVSMKPSNGSITTFDFLFYAYGFSVIFSVIVAISYHHRYASKASFFFVAAIINLVMSKLSYYAGIYLEFEEFFYVFICFEIIGIACLLKYVEKKPLENIPLV